ncbi:hypothetical protein [Candidatus Uabimicrobium sp. HlEnr_7]|uniref:hypothetical protein n=1 Tax=Candidatus Uabimicrobium helgolandensis TaxID=3095367 RepID=UPI0035576621
MLYKKMIIVFVFCIQVLFADKWDISRKELEKQGINYKTLINSILSEQHQFVLAYSILSKEDKAKGNVYALHKFTLEKDGKIGVHTVKLPIFFFGGIALTNKGRSAIVVGNYGTKILRVSTKSLKFKTIYEYKKGVSGYKANVFTVGHRGKVFLDGYFYDENQFSQGDYIVEFIEKRKKKTVDFVKKIDLKKLYNKLGGVPKVMNLHTGDIAYISVPNYKERQTYLHYYNKGKTEIVDKGLLIGAFAGAHHRLFYTVLRDKKTRRSYVKDLKTKKVWEFGKPQVPYTYPFISKDGKVILACTVDIKEQRMTVYVAREQDDYKLHVLLDDVSVGPFKLSNSGDYYLYYNNKGIAVEKMSSKE